MPAEPSHGRLPRILFPITINFGLRYVLLTGLAERLAADAVPVLGLTWDAPELVAQLRDAGHEAVVLPPHELDRPTRVLRHAARLDLEIRLASPTSRIDHRMRVLDRPRSVRWRRTASYELERARRRAPGAPPAGRAEVAAALEESGVVEPHRRALVDLEIDAVASITPFADQETALLIAAASLGLPRLASLLSFDNPTTRPPLPVSFDRTLVWNAWNRDELLRGDPELDRATVALTGPPQFDLYRDPSLVEPREAWAERLGLALGAPTVLFGAGPPSIAPHEGQYLDHVLGAIGATLPANLAVVLRRHPHDHPGRWTRFVDRPGVHVDDPGPVGGDLRPGEAAMGRREVVSLCSTLAHTDVHVSTSSTMTLDGAWFDKPQIGPAYDVVGPRHHRRHALDLYRREHYVPIVRSGGIELPRRPEELVAQIASALRDPGRLAAERRAMLESLCTWTDGRSTERLAAEVRRFLADAGLGVRSG
jgi:hypothetical protein